MKYIKTYEQNNEIVFQEKNPQIGDYVICEDSGVLSTEVSNFIENNIGQIIDIYDYYVIKYENIPNNFKHNFVFTDDDGELYEDCTIMEYYEIKKWSPNKEDLEIYININKYNL